MADPIQPTPASPPIATSGRPTPAPVASVVEGGASKGQSTPTLPASNLAAAEAAKRGGRPGGKPTLSGFPAGSPEDVAFNKRKDNERKKADYHAKRAAMAPVPAPLPARPATGLDQTASQAPTPLDPGSAQAGPLVPWTGEDLSPALADTLELLEEAEKTSIQSKLTKARITGDLEKEIMTAARWPVRPKQGISKYGGSALAKGLNALSISATHKDVALIAPSLATLALDRVRLHSRLDKLIKIAEQNAAAAQKPTAEKK